MARPARRFFLATLLAGIAPAVMLLALGSAGIGSARGADTGAARGVVDTSTPDATAQNFCERWIWYADCDQSSPDCFTDALSLSASWAQIEGMNLVADRAGCDANATPTATPTEPCVNGHLCGLTQTAIAGTSIAQTATAAAWTPTSTPTETYAPTATATDTATPGSSPTATETPSPTVTETPEPTLMPTPTSTSSLHYRVYLPSIHRLDGVLRRFPPQCPARWTVQMPCRR